MSSGSEKRKRRDRLSIRFAPDEMNRLMEAAERSALAPSSYIRKAVLGGEPLRAARRPPVEVKLLARTLGELGKIGSNLNQIARALNAAPNSPASETPHIHSELRRAANELVTMRTALLVALGRNPR